MLLNASIRLHPDPTIPPRTAPPTDGPTLHAAMAIANAIGHPTKTAANSQQEIVVEGRGIQRASTVFAGSVIRG